MLKLKLEKHQLTYCEDVNISGYSEGYSVKATQVAYVNSN